MSVTVAKNASPPGSGGAGAGSPDGPKKPGNPGNPGNSASSIPPPPANRGFRALRSLVIWLDRGSYGVLVAAMALMAITVSLQVFWRYVLGSSIDAADELSRLFFVWAIFLAIPHGVRHGIHVGIDLFVIMLPASVQAGLFRLMTAASAVLMGVVMLAAVTAVMDRWQEMMPTLAVTSAVYYIAVLISAGHAFLHLITLAWGGPRTWEGEQQ